MVVPAEKRQLDMVNMAYANLHEKAAANQLSAEVLLKLSKFVECMVARNYAGATAVQTVMGSFKFKVPKLFLNL